MGAVPHGLVFCFTNSGLARVNLVANTFLVLVTMLVLVFVFVMVLAMVVLLVSVLALFPVMNTMFAMAVVLPIVVAMAVAMVMMTAVVSMVAVAMVVATMMMTVKINRIQIFVDLLLDRVDMTMLIHFFVVVMTGSVLFDHRSIHAADDFISSNDRADMGYSTGENEGGNTGLSDRGTTKRHNVPIPNFLIEIEEGWRLFAAFGAVYRKGGAKEQV